MLRGQSVWKILSRAAVFYIAFHICKEYITKMYDREFKKSYCEHVNCNKLPTCVCLQVVGLYRLCGSAAVKKELREAFERDSHAVELCENMYPDVNVITGNVKVLH